jgi:large subunit ribosomal protein L1
MWDPPKAGFVPRNYKKRMSKRMDNLKALIKKDYTYPWDEAIKLAKTTSGVKFDAAVEIHAHLGIDPKKGEQQIRSTVVLPHGTGKSKKIAAFVTAEREKEAKEAGADFVYGEEDIKKIKDTEKIEFDIAVTTPDMMPKLATIAKVLGPKGLMPNPKTETVGPQLKKMIEELKKGKVTFKNDDTSNIHQSIGKVSFSEAQLKENLSAFIDALKKAKPASAKGTYLQSLILSTSMGPSIKISSEG